MQNNAKKRAKVAEKKTISYIRLCSLRFQFKIEFGAPAQYNANNKELTLLLKHIFEIHRFVSPFVSFVARKMLEDDLGRGERGEVRRWKTGV